MGEIRPALTPEQWAARAMDIASDEDAVRVAIRMIDDEWGEETDVLIRLRALADKLAALRPPKTP